MLRTTPPGSGLAVLDEGHRAGDGLLEVCSSHVPEKWLRSSSWISISSTSTSGIASVLTVNGIVGMVGTCRRIGKDGATNRRFLSKAPV